MKHKIKLLSILLGLALANCTSVKPYQKMYLSDEDMDLAAKKIERMESNFELYREGAAGGNGGKVSGGCGCN